MVQKSGLALVAISVAAAAGALGCRPAGRVDPPVRLAAEPGGCALPPRYDTWVRRALATWEHVSREELRLPPAAPPVMVFFDRRCVYELAPPADSAARSRAGAGVLNVRGARYRGEVPLPDGRRIVPAASAFASLHRGDSAAFFVMALEEVWRDDTRAWPDQDWEGFLLRTMVHEMVHTRQLPALAHRLGPLQQYFRLGVLDDDIVQHRFAAVPGFGSAVEAERDMFYAAAEAVDGATRRRRAFRALQMMHARRASHFRGEAEPYAELEGLFLDMEGAAQWAALATARLRAGPLASRAAVLDHVRSDTQWWSQDEGLAIYMALDAIVPEWRRRVFPPELASALDLLGEAVGFSPGVAGPRRASNTRSP